MRLTWHNYNYYPYERDLAVREIAALLGRDDHRKVDDGVEIQGVVDSNPVARLTYFSGAVNGQGFIPTVQSRLEEAARNGSRRQSTRYSVHGLHEYKGKFNPQVVKALLNIFRIEAKRRVLDPFCGSGTTLVECAHIGAVGVGTDVNPLAIQVARAKLKMLCTPAQQLKKLYKRLRRRLRGTRRADEEDDRRRAYLASWFDSDVLYQIEALRSAIEDVGEDSVEIFLVVASNLLRDYSRQDPNDLRTRRRKTPLPEVPFETAFLEAMPPLIERVDATQAVLGTDLPLGKALLCDVTGVTVEGVGGIVDAAITSPPYAMALPYIDTQRLSLVWLGLCPPEEIGKLEAELIGSREFRGSARRTLLQQLIDNASNLPCAQSRICLALYRALGKEDGIPSSSGPAVAVSLLYLHEGELQDGSNGNEKGCTVRHDCRAQPHNYWRRTA